MSPKTSLPKIGSVNFELSLWSDFDAHLFLQGSHFRLYEKLGSHAINREGLKGTYFAVWAPNAYEVSVIGDFNGWNGDSHKLGCRFDGTGVWEGFIPNLEAGQIYKYLIKSKFHGYVAEKQDPFAFLHEEPPRSASRVAPLAYTWEDQSWMKSRASNNALKAPWSVYEVHLGSWRRKPEEGHRPLTYREMAPELASYVKDLGFTHVELLPITEHPFYGSWGYQCTGYFAPTARYGTPKDFMYLVDYLHQNGIGVILDWVPSHFASDGHALYLFDGTHLYEHMDMRKGYHPDWGSFIFNYGRPEVRSFLISSAFYWLDRYHIDGLRIDAVASMLYLDYSRRHGEWVPNQFGGKENLEAIDFLKRLNEEVYRHFPDVQTIAEESTAFTKVSKPVYDGGLGFGFKWNMGWMNDTIRYFSKDAIYRKFHQNDLTFSLIYAFTENFMLPFSHDEVVHGKASMLQKMSGVNDWEKFANLRTLLGYMFMHPGQKLIFMGTEFGQWNEWYHERSLDWHLLDYDLHRQMLNWVRDLNSRFRTEKALHHNFSYDGFYWVDFNDWQQSVLSFMRRSEDGKEMILTVCNFTPIPRENYRIGVPHAGYWEEILNSNAQQYGGNGMGNWGGMDATPWGSHNQPYSLCLTIPPLSVSCFKRSLS